MGKYEPLQHYLENYESNSWPASFAKIEEVLGFELPMSAYNYYAWWANETSGSHSHAKSWQAAGWITREVDLKNLSVRFERANRTDRKIPAQATQSGPEPLPGSLAPILDLAARILKIDDRTEIMRIALESLIQRSVGSELASLGGSMPDLQVPHRERPTM